MVTENNALINGFLKGMNSDISYHMMDDLSYALANNLRITSLDQENKFGELHTIEGIRLTTCEQLLDCLGILAATSIRNIGVIIVAFEDTWRVYTFEVNDDNKVRENVFEDIEELKLVFNSGVSANRNKFSIVGRYESSDNIKLYIADGDHPVICLNVAEYNERSLEELIQNASGCLNAPKFKEYVSGSIPVGMVCYAYMLYNKNTNFSAISPVSELIPIYNRAKDEGLLENKQSDCGVSLTIDTTGVNFDHISVYRILYVQKNQLPIVTLIQDSKIRQADTITIVDTGGTSLGTYTLELLNNIQGIRIVPQVIEAKDDYLFAGNIKDENLDYDEEIRNWDARAYRFTAAGKCTLKQYGTDDELIINSVNDVVPYDHDCFQDINDINEVYKGSEMFTYPVNNKQRLGGSGKNIEWYFVYHKEVVDSDVDKLSVHRQNNTDTTVYSVLYDHGSYDKETTEYSSDKTIMNSLGTGELYRYGIILYDKFGRKSSVKWIADIRTPEEFLFAKNGNTFESKKLGLSFKVNNLPESVVQYEIVKCKRDAKDIRNVTHGVLSRPIAKYEVEQISNGNYKARKASPWLPTGFITLGKGIIGIDKVGFELRDTGRDGSPVIYPTDVQWSQYENLNIDDYITGEQSLGKNFGEFKRQATSYENDNFFQFISPEFAYFGQDTLDLLKNKQLNLRVLSSYSVSYSNNLNIRTVGAQQVANKPYKITSESMLHTYYRINHQYGPNFPKDFLGWDSDGYIVLNCYDPKGVIEIEKNDLDSIKPDLFSYVKLYNCLDLKQLYNPIDAVGKAQTSNWNDFADEAGNVNFVSNNAVSGTESFCNWTVSGNYGMSWRDIVSDTTDITHCDFSKSVISAGGPCGLIKTSEVIQQTNANGTYYAAIQQYVIPYNGYTYQGRQTDVYYSNGCVYSKDHNDVILFDGDKHLNIFEYVSAHKIYEPKASTTLYSTSIIYAIPVETSVDLTKTSGNKFSRHNDEQGISNLQIQPSNVYEKYIQSKPLYEYNTIYGQQNLSVPNSAQLDEDYLNDQTIDYRVHHSELKTNDERIDSWLKFNSNEYLDVDTKYGQITNLRKFDNRLYFWQENAVGVLSVNDRTVINAEDKMPLVLGVGGVLVRYDYLDTTSGMSANQFCDTQSDHSLYYFDDKDLSIRMIQLNQAVDLSQVRNVKSVMLLEKSEVNNPKMFYDNIYKEVIFNVLNKKSITYNESLLAFTSLYDIDWSESINFRNKTYLINDNSKIAQWNCSDPSNVVARNWNDALNIKLKYSVNKGSTTVKVFDNQEFITSRIGQPYQNLKYTYSTDIQKSSAHRFTEKTITDREGNYRFAIPRVGDATFGSRRRGKYLICEIDGPANTKLSWSYIITKFRGSMS